MRRTLTLRREALTELTTLELAGVAAASALCPVVRKVDAITDKIPGWPTNEGCTPAYGG